MLLCAFLEGRRRSTPPRHKRPRSSNTAGGPWLVFPESSRSGRRRGSRRWSPLRVVCPPYPARVRRLCGFVCAVLLCVTASPPSFDVCVITRSVRYYLAIGVSSAGARESVETGRGSDAASSCGRECKCRCNGAAAPALVSRLPQRRRAVVAGRCAASQLYARGCSDAHQQRSVMSDAGAA